MSYAICVWGELRGVKSTINSFYKFMVEPLNADVFLLCQRALPDDDERFALFDRNIVFKHLYNKPELSTYFGEQSYQDAIRRIQYNWIKDSNAQQYVNFHKYAQVLMDHPVKYKKYIFVRSDFLYLVPFPDVHNLLEKDDLFFCFNGHQWNGINYTLMSVPNVHVNSYLISPYEFIADNQKRNEMANKHTAMNCEQFMKHIFDKHGWTLAFIKHNGFISAETSQDRTTWMDIKYDENHKVLFKYKDQMDEAYNTLECWNAKKKWNVSNHVNQIMRQQSFIIHVDQHIL